ncbi:unnamed protein product [Bursaphelenchus okinawaensis]|uniref:Copper transport protein n=1 Tax=Bursaphelenchus okinawaensis TaxID=465554 RepID=A0A811LKY9_9BILA|nr:unnamed protein product [Bursaphelenchus okinawaensis]CAG9125900.1 unnamed protein product [Bursaphelenchus okinawaensis]
MDHSHHGHHQPDSTTAAPVMDHAHHGHHQHDSATAAPLMDHSQHMHHEHTMKMYFHFGFEEVILFDFWRTDSFVGILFSSLIIFIMAALYEGLKWVRVYLQTYASSKQKCHHIELKENNATTEDALISKNNDNTATLKSDDVYKSTVTREARPKVRGLDRFLKHIDVHNPSPFSSFRLLQTFLYCLQLTVAYWLMLIAMTYNVYLTAMVVIGAGFGHWLFALIQIQPSLAEKQDAFASDACH